MNLQTGEEEERVDTSRVVSHGSYEEEVMTMLDFAVRAPAALTTVRPAPGGQAGGVVFGHAPTDENSPQSEKEFR